MHACNFLEKSFQHIRKNIGSNMMKRICEAMAINLERIHVKHDK